MVGRNKHLALGGSEGISFSEELTLQFKIETERETDGRWIVEIPEIPGALAYGKTEEEAKANAYALALRSIADDVEKSHAVPKSINIDCLSP